MSWLLKFSLLGVFVFSSCFFESNESNESNNELPEEFEKNGSSGSVPHLSFKTDGKVIRESEFSANFSIREITDEYFNLFSEDSICNWDISEDGNREYYWDQYGKNHVFYQLRNDSLSFNLFDSWKIVHKNDAFIGEWMIQSEEILRHIELSKDSLKIKISNDYNCVADWFIVDGGNAKKIDCNTVELNINDKKLVYGLKPTEQGFVANYTFEGVSCQVEVYETDNITSQQECEELTIKYDDKSCDNVFKSLEGVFPKGYMCRKKYLQDGQCDPNCWNFEDKEDCEGIRFEKKIQTLRKNLIFAGF